MKELGVVRRRLSGKEADPYIGIGRKILGEMKNIMQMGGIKQLSWTKDLQNGVRIVVSSIFGQDEIRISLKTGMAVLAQEVTPMYSYTNEATLWVKTLNPPWPLTTTSYTFTEYDTNIVATGRAFTVAAENGITAEAFYEGYLFYAIFNPTDPLTTGLQIRRRNIDTGEDSAVYLYSVNVSINAAVTITSRGLLYVMGFNTPRAVMISKDGAVVFDVAVNRALGIQNMSGVNNGTTAYFFHNNSSSAAGVVEVDIANGTAVNYSPNSEIAPPSNDKYYLGATGVANDSKDFYAYIRFSLEVDPTYSAEVVKSPYKNEALNSKYNLDHIDNSFGTPFMDATYIHASIAMNGKALFANEFNYVVMDTKTDTALANGGVQSLTGYSETKPFSNGDVLKGYGFILPIFGKVETEFDYKTQPVPVVNDAEILIAAENGDLFKFNTDTIQLTRIKQFPMYSDFFVHYKDDADYYQRRNSIYALSWTDN